MMSLSSIRCLSSLVAMMLVASMAPALQAFAPLAASPRSSSSTSLQAVSLPLEEFGGDDYSRYRVQDPPTLDATLPSHTSLMEALEKRKREVSLGLGKRFVAVLPHEGDGVPVATMAGIPIYSEPNQDGNIVGYMKPGTMVMTEARRGPWIKHTEGGWTLSYKGAIRYLQPVNE